MDLSDYINKTMKVISDPPTSQKDSNPKMVNGKVLDESGVMDFYNQYLSSDWYKKRLLNNGYGLSGEEKGIEDTIKNNQAMSLTERTQRVDQLIRNRTNTVNSTELRVSDDDKTHYYKQGINISPREMRMYGDNPNSVAAHELGHGETSPANGLRISPFEREVYNTNRKPFADIKTKRGKYLGIHTEAKSDINALRYDLFKAGLFNPKTGQYKTKDGLFDQTMIPATKGNVIDSLKDAYGDEGLINLMNTIASNDNIERSNLG